MPGRKWLMLSGEGLRCSEQQPENHNNHQIKGNIIFIYFPLSLSLSAWVSVSFQLWICFFPIDCGIFFLVKMTIIPAVFWRIIQHDQRIVIIPLIWLNYHNLFINDINAWTELHSTPPPVATVFVWKTHSSQRMTKNHFCFTALLFSSAF